MLTTAENLSSDKRGLWEENEPERGVSGGQIGPIKAGGAGGGVSYGFVAGACGGSTEPFPAEMRHPVLRYTDRERRQRPRVPAARLSVPAACPAHRFINVPSVGLGQGGGLLQEVPS